MMKPINHMLSTWTLVCGSCLAWIGTITFALVYCFDLSPTSAWLIAGSLGISATLAISVILYEIRNAIVLPEDADPAEFDMFPVPPRKNPQPRVAKIRPVPARRFRVPREVF